MVQKQNTEVSDMKTIEIKKWLLDKGLKQMDIARAAKVSPTCVSLVIKGVATSQNVKGILEAMGCPEEFLRKKAA